MSGSRAAKRYAKAVLLLATEANLETVVYDDMQSVTATIFGSNELNEMLQSPVYKDEDKKQAIELLIKTAEEMVKSAGKKYMMSISRSKSLLNIHEKLGWNIDKTASHEMVKIIN